MEKMPGDEITSAQVVFPDKQTLDEVYKKQTETIAELASKIEKLEAAAAAE